MATFLHMKMHVRASLVLVLASVACLAAARSERQALVFTLESPVDCNCNLVWDTLNDQHQGVGQKIAFDFGFNLWPPSFNPGIMTENAPMVDWLEVEAPSTYNGKCNEACTASISGCGITVVQAKVALLNHPKYPLYIFFEMKGGGTNMKQLTDESSRKFGGIDNPKWLKGRKSGNCDEAKNELILWVNTPEAGKKGKANFDKAYIKYVFSCCKCTG